MKNLKKRIRSGKISVGSWITIADLSSAEIMARSGFDWLTIDMEHSAITLNQAENLIRVIELSGTVPFVRVGENSANVIKRVMDAGSHGVIVPMVNTREDAMRAVNAVKYPPAGKRGVGLARAQGYGMAFEAYKKWAAKESILVVQIEHEEAVANLREILSVEGVDASIVGPYDLSASLGRPGDFENKKLKKSIKTYIDTCNSMRKPAGFHVIPPDASKLNDKRREGFKFIGFSLDTLFLGMKLKDEMKKVKK